VGATGTAEGSTRTEGPSRLRGIVAAVVAILVVAVTLVLSRLDLANEVAVVRSQLTVANQELAENEREIDELEDQAREQSEAVDSCRESAELGQRVLAALQVVDRGLERGDTGTVARGVADLLRVESQWTRANRACLEATGEGS
jgi:chromosome segregation ATPase